MQRQGWQAITGEWQHLTLCGLPNCPCSSLDPADCEMGCPADFCEPSHVWEDGTIPIAMQNASFVEMMPLRSCWNNLLWYGNRQNRTHRSLLLQWTVATAYEKILFC
jgi:hypothetical protein